MKSRFGIFFITIVTPLLGCQPSGPATVEHGNVCIDLSSDGESIVFSSAGGDLYIFNLADSSVNRLTETERIESYPSFSPDGKSIVFSASKGNSAPHHIFLMDRLTLETKQLTDDPNTADILPRFTHDGSRIVFARAIVHRPYSLGGWTWDQWDACEIAADGTGFSQLTNESFYHMYRIIPLTDGAILFAAVMGTEDDSSIALYSTHRDGKLDRVVPKRLKENAGVNAWASDPMVAPDGITLAFCSDRNRAFWYDVCLLENDNELKCLVGDKSRYNRYPDFFPDGNRVVFLAGTDFNAYNRAIYSLWEVTADGQTNELASAELFTDPTSWTKSRVAEQRDKHEVAER